MILAGKEARYIRHRVLPIMYTEENPNARKKTDFSGATALPWELPKKIKQIEQLPSWVKVQPKNNSNNNTTEESDLSEDSDSCHCDKLDKLSITAPKAAAAETHGSSMALKSTVTINNKKKIIGSSFVDTIAQCEAI